MRRPDKEEYDFNEEWETLRFAKDMIKYADYLENEIESYLDNLEKPQNE